MPTRIIREPDVQRLVTMAEALEAVELAFREQAHGTGINQPRRRVHQPEGVLHMMSGALTERGYWGFKAYTATRQGVRFMVNLYDVTSGAPLAIIEADYLGQIRTGAASGVATRYLAPPEAATLALFGTGYQAETQLEAIAHVCALQDVRVYSRTQEKRENFAFQMSERLSLPVRAVGSPAEALEGAAIITTATTSREPVFDGKALGTGVHINAAGSNAIIRSELDRTTIRRASRIFTDDLEQARIESGNLVMARERNAFDWAQARLMADVVGGLTSGRSSAEEITLFLSHGIALWDIALAATVYERAQAENIGSLVALFES